jgi:hypothetical protein
MPHHLKLPRLSRQDMNWPTRKSVGSAQLLAQPNVKSKLLTPTTCWTIHSTRCLASSFAARDEVRKADSRRYYYPSSLLPILVPFYFWGLQGRGGFLEHGDVEHFGLERDNLVIPMPRPNNAIRPHAKWRNMMVL